VDKNVCCSSGKANYQGNQGYEIETAPPTSTPAILMDGKDNVATALQNLPEGATVPVSARTIRLLSPIPFGHKFALVDIAAGQPVVKYGEVIGLAKAPIAIGDHVHRHNVDHRVETIITEMKEKS
jgi:altronate dehydratase small subunit